MPSPWFRFAANAHADSQVRRARAGAVWPWVLCRLKDGDGVATDDDLHPEAAADACHDVEVAAAARQLDGLRRVGLLVPAEGGGWTTPRWPDYQPDPSGADRARRHRWKDRNGYDRDVTARHVTSRDVTPATVRHGASRDVTAVTVDRTGQDKTGQDVPPVSEVVGTSSRARADEPPPAAAGRAAQVAEGQRPPETPIIPGLRTVAERWAHATGRAPSLATRQRLEALSTEVGPERVVAAINQAVEADGRGGITLAFVAAIARRLASHSEPTPTRRARAQAQRPHSSHGIYEAHGVAPPAPRRWPPSDDPEAF